MRRGWKVAAVALAAGTIPAAAYVYRTLELGRADAQPVMLEILNPGGELVGPEGLAIDAQGRIYVGDAQGVVWSMDPGGQPALYGDPRRLGEGIHIGGLGFDAAGNLYGCAYGFAGGSVVRVERGTGAVSLWARDIGVANFLTVTADRKHAWVSDYRRNGRLLRFDLTAPSPARADFEIGGVEYPNGLALGDGERTLYVAETYSGRIARVTLGERAAEVERVIDLAGPFASGSVDGLAFDPRDQGRRFLHVAENIRGLVTVVDVQARPARVLKRYRLARMGERPCPASIEIRGDYLYFTDLWSASPLRIVLGLPRYHHHAYRFHVADLTAVY